MPAIAVPCPFQEAFQFAYQNNSHGFCREPMSQMKPCAEDGKYRFQFKKCRDVYDTYDRGDDSRKMTYKQYIFSHAYNYIGCDLWCIYNSESQMQSNTCISFTFNYL